MRWRDGVEALRKRSIARLHACSGVCGESASRDTLTNPVPISTGPVQRLRRSRAMGVTETLM